MKKLLLLLVLLLPLFSFSQKEGQELIDSLMTELPKMREDTTKVNAFNDLCQSYQYIDPIAGIKYGQQGLDLARKIKWNDGIAMAYRNIGINYSIDSDFNKALEFYRKALKSTNNKKITSKILRSAGLVYTYQNNYTKALDYDMQALKLSEEVRDKKGVAAVLSNIGIIYFDLADYPKAIFYYEKARKINEEMNNLGYLSNNLGNLGNCYSALAQNKKAIQYYFHAIKINDDLGDIGNKAINLGAIANSYWKIYDYDNALKYAKESLKLSEEINEERNISHSIGLIGDIYFEKSIKAKSEAERKILLEQAIVNFNKVLAFEKNLQSVKEIGDAYLHLSNAHAMLGNYKKATGFYALAYAYKDSVFNEDNKQSIKNIEDKRTIELRDKQIQLNKLTLQSKEKEKWLYIFGIGFLLISAGFIYKQSRNRKKNNEQLQLLNSELDSANKVKARFFSILNHDLRSPVSSLINFLHLQKESPELLTEESRQRMENKTISAAENLLESMEDILLWSKGQMENFKPHPENVTIRSVFEDLDKHFSGIERVKISFENPGDMALFTDENYLKTILRNLTGNAIKALEKTENATINLKAYTASGEQYISISDNGPGGTKEQFRALYDEKEVVGIKTGLGLHLIRDLAKAINCKILVDPNPDSGTTFTLIFQ
ncbi:MAG TPA: tetratricopeptide repeat-containing sensor histidine kinase [Flavobacterium sp.]|nr:tetratricopeptide repeat-containing sensor histidine kinase [Flavobacterium sp.]